MVCDLIILQTEFNRTIEFTRVLHVPQLRNNLLSCLYLNRHKGFHIHIDAKTMDFDLDKKTLFCATINSNISAHLDGVTAPVEFANLSATLPLDLNQWCIMTCQQYSMHKVHFLCCL